MNRYLTWFEIISAGMLLLTGSAEAHRITVFAWTEGDTVYVQSKFSGGKRVRGGEVVVADLQGKEILTGKTDDQGEFSFKVPERATLKIVVMAGMGHRGEWTIPIEEFGGAFAHVSEPEKKIQPEPSASAPDSKMASLAPEASGRPASALSPTDIQRIMEKALDKKLKPLMKMMVQSQQDHGPTFKDILGGIGYIFGLMGIAAYVNFRRSLGKGQEGQPR